MARCHLALPVLAGTLLLQAGCGDSEEVAYGEVDLIDRSSGGFGAGVRSVNGTYGPGCTDRAGAWSLAVDAGAPLTNPELSVVLNDAACDLTLTSLVVDAAATAATPAIDLGTSYQVSASMFGDPVVFYANAKLSTVDFETDFVLTILYSDDPTQASGDNTAAFEVVESSVTAEEVAAPDYTLDVSGIAVQTDAANIVQAASGSAILTSGAVSGQRYAVVEAASLDTYAEIDAAYLAATDAAVAGSLPASDFTLVGSDLTGSQVRTLIIANLANGVRSYQAFEITFNAAPLG